MRILVVYSSRTGNTKKVAEAIFSILPQGAVLASVGEAPDPEPFDCLLLGFWNRRAAPDPAMLAYMARIHGKQVGLFGTQGAWPDSDHGKRFLENARAAVKGNEVLAEFVCMGRVDPALLAREAALPPEKQRHQMTVERQKRLAEAANHPDEKDLALAKAVFANMLAGAQAS